jgi:hypothetical protein
MRRIFTGIIVYIIIAQHPVRGDEGMWLLPLIEELNIPVMQEKGLQLSADDIYSINHSSLKDAIIIFGGGCTGEIVSNQGLIFTNHHCGYDYIQDNSSLGHNYLKDGFWAQSQSEELPNSDLEVRFLKRIENVTDKVFAQLSDTLDVVKRSVLINDIIKQLEDSASEQGKYEAQVDDFFDGNEYYLMVYQVYKDVRLVGTPPSSIGKFGDETDNWEWPRHTGDFSIFRVYSAPDGTPASFAPENVPLRTDTYLPISLQGISEGDMTFVLGYPGATNRYLCSYGIREIMEVSNQTRIKIRTTYQQILKKDMLSDPEMQIQYASKYASSSNYWKYAIGQNRRLNALHIIDKHQADESRFQEWADSDSARSAEYGHILSDMSAIYGGRKSSILNLTALNESFFLATELIGYISNFEYLYMLLQIHDNTGEIDTEIENLTRQTEKFFKDYDIATDKKVANAMFELYRELIPESRQPDLYATIQKKYKGNIDQFVNYLYSHTFFTEKEKTLDFLKNPTLKALLRDPGFKLSSSIFRKYIEEYSLYDSFKTKLNDLDRLYMKAKMQMYPDSSFYPDANFTMRLSYGNIMGYSPADAAHYDAFTSLKGVMEKEDTTSYEFIVPDKLKELYREKDFGNYAENEKMPVCFITNNDITGGSSGSPVLNEKGALIGLAFDGNWEAMSSDIAYEPELQRCICVDIRYVLFIIDKFAGNGKLLNELSIIQ